MKLNLGNRRIAVLGGDLRMMAAAKALAADGFSVTAYGMETFTGDPGSVVRTETLDEALKDAFLAVLPLPVTRDGERLLCPLTRKTVLLRDVFAALPAGCRAAGGKPDASVRALAREYGIGLSDYFDREEIAVANAVPTAEGAIAAAMAETPYTIHGTRCLILGYGRIGRVLARLLRALGADVTAAARRAETLAWIAAEDCTPLPFSSLAKSLPASPLDFDIVFNTVPEQAAGAAVLERLPRGTLLIDLASPPGGFDRIRAEELGMRLVWALSLPAKTAPLTAGGILHDGIRNLIAEWEGEDTT